MKLIFKVGWFMHNNWLFVIVHYIVIIYYILTLLVTANDVWMDLTLLISKIPINKKNAGKSESINYTLLNEKRIHHDKKNVHISCWITAA